MSVNNLPPNLPRIKAGWSWVDAENICKRVTDGTHDTPKYFEQGVPLITSKNLKNNSIDFDNIKYISNDDHEDIKRRSGVDNGDVLFAMIGTIGNPVLVNTKIEFSIKNVGLFKKNESKILSKYLQFWLSSFKLKKLLDEKEFIKGTTQKFIPLKNLRKVPIPLPPLPEQKKIVEKIEELFSGLDSGVASLKKAKEQLRLYRQSVLASAFSGRLTPSHPEFISGSEKLKRVQLDNIELPDGWKWVKLGEATRLNPKLPFDEIKESTLVSFLPMKQVEELTGKFDLSLERKYSEVKKSFTPFTDADVIFAKITPCMENGKIAVMNNLRNKIGFGSTEFHVFRTNNDLINQYLFYFLIQDSFRAKAQHNMTGAVGQKRVPRRFLEESEIPLPPLNQQTQIVEEIESRFTGSEAIEKAIDDSLDKSEALRQSILKKAFEGQLV